MGFAVDFEIFLIPRLEGLKKNNNLNKKPNKKRGTGLCRLPRKDKDNLSAFFFELEKSVVRIMRLGYFVCNTPTNRTIRVFYIQPSFFIDVIFIQTFFNYARHNIFLLDDYGGRKVGDSRRTVDLVLERFGANEAGLVDDAIDRATTVLIDNIGGFDLGGGSHVPYEKVPNIG